MATPTDVLRALVKTQGILLDQCTEILKRLDRIEAKLGEQDIDLGADAPPWGDWESKTIVEAASLPPVVMPPPAEEQRAVIHETQEEVTVELPKPSPERMVERLGFAQHQLDLDGHLGAGMNEAYAKGGPLWLYYGNRDFVMGLPVDWRRKMVEDVLTFSPQEAAEMGADVLKDTSPGDPEITTEAIWNTRQ